MIYLNRAYCILLMLFLVFSCQKEPLIFPEQEDPSFQLMGSADNNAVITLAAGVNGYEMAFTVPDTSENISQYSGIVAGPDCVDNCIEKLEFFYTYRAPIPFNGNSIEFNTTDGIDDLVEDEKLCYSYTHQVATGPDPKVRLLQGTEEDSSSGSYEFCLRELSALQQPWIEVVVDDFFNYTIHPGMPDLTSPCQLNISSKKPEDGNSRTITIQPFTDADITINWIDSDGKVTSGSDFKLSDSVVNLTAQIIGADCFIELNFGKVNSTYRGEIDFSFLLKQVTDPITSNTELRDVRIAYTNPRGQVYVSQDGASILVDDIKEYTEMGLADDLISYNVLVNCSMINTMNMRDSFTLDLSGQLLTEPF